MQLQHQTWQEVAAYLENANGVIVPIGSTEQHGPTGLIGTDALCAEAIAQEVGATAGALVAPVIGIGMAQHHMAFPGSMSLRPTTLIAVIRDQVWSLAQHGFRRFFFINGHGGNINSIRAAFSEIHAAAGAGEMPVGLRLGMNCWWESRELMALAREQFGSQDGHHATASEISVTRHLLPHLAKQAPLVPPIAPVGPINDAADFRRRFPDGRIGSNPALATAEKGAALMACSVKALVQRYQSFLDQD